MADLLGSVSLFGFGAAIGVLGVFVLLYWIIDEYRDADGAAETAEGVAERSGSVIVVASGVLLTIGDQIVRVLGDLAGMVDSPVVVGHVVGGILGFLGLNGVITVTEFIVGFAVVTLIALAWRASVEGRGLRR